MRKTGKLGSYSNPVNGRHETDGPPAVLEVDGASQLPVNDIFAGSVELRDGSKMGAIKMCLPGDHTLTFFLTDRVMQGLPESLIEIREFNGEKQ